MATYTRPLTPRQREVLDLWMAGTTYRDVATALGMAPGTVYPHLKAIRRKLGASSTSRDALRRSLSEHEEAMGVDPQEAMGVDPQEASRLKEGGR